MATAQPTLQERKFNAAFTLLDTDKDDHLSWDDCLMPLEKARQSIGCKKENPRFQKVLKSQRACWDRMLQTQDLDKDGKISRAEYTLFFFRVTIEMASSNKMPAWILEYCHNVHRALDLDGDGAVEQKEYALYLRSIGSDADAKAVFAKLDLNKNGKISTTEMEELWLQWGLSNDPNSPGNYLMTGKF